jgi:tRNA isopentenyl-2-thiomethyl-A-37 hydroxylase MiaE
MRNKPQKASLETAAKVIKMMRRSNRDGAISTFIKYVDEFKLTTKEELEKFASSSGFIIARNIRVMDSK